MDIFLSYARTEVVADGRSSYDFLGGSISVAYKHGWHETVIPAGKRIAPTYPTPSEWTADWLVTLVAAKMAGESFSVVELGAGYGQWMVTAIRAFKSLRENGIAHGLAIEADIVHFEWLKQHTDRNLGHFSHVTTDLIYAAAGRDGEVEFPILDDPAKDYGASYIATVGRKFSRVPSMSLATAMKRLDSKVLDLLHIDIQGAEEDLLLNNEVAEPLARVKFILIGTHISSELHDRIKSKIMSLGFTVILEWPRNSLVMTSVGQIKTTDGVLAAFNSTRVDGAAIEAYFKKYETLGYDLR